MNGIVIRKSATRHDLTVDGQVFDLSDKKNMIKATDLVLAFLNSKGYFKK